MAQKNKLPYALRVCKWSARLSLAVPPAVQHPADSPTEVAEDDSNTRPTATLVAEQDGVSGFRLQLCPALATMAICLVNQLMSSLALCHSDFQTNKQIHLRKRKVHLLYW